MATVKTNSGKKKYVIYTRCSTDDQAKGDFTTLDAQAHHCKNMLDAFGYELADFGKKGLINDDGYSGKDLNRPGIRAILESVNNKREFDGIIFFRLDRLTRNPRDLYALIDLFKAKDVDFISVRENLDSSTAIGRVVIGIFGLLSAFERELTGERVKASAIARVRQGRWVGGILPYGYKRVDDGPQLPDGRQPRKIVVDDEVAPHLINMWEMAAENRSLTEIGLELTKRGIKTPKGKEWRRQCISNIIKNPFYKGYIQYAEEIHKGTHPAIVDEKLWAKANKVLLARLPGHHFKKKPGEYNYLLSGLLKCPKCGSYYISVSAAGKTGRKFFYYVCARAKQGLGCDAQAISATAFDKALIEYFKKASEDREIIVKAIGDAILDSQIKLEEIERTLKGHEKELEAARGEAKKLLDMALGGTIAQGATFKAKMAALDEEILKLEDKTAKLQAKKSATQMSAYSGEFLHSNIRFAMQYLDEAPPDAQKSLLRTLIKEIVVYEDRIELRMYVSRPVEDTMACAMPVNGGNGKQKRPTFGGGALTDPDKGLSGCQDWLPVYLSLRTKKGVEEPEICFRILYLTGPDKREILEQTVETALGPNGAFDNGNIGSLKRTAPMDKVTAIPPPRGSPRPLREPRTPRVAELLRKAIKWKGLLETGQIPSQAEIARQEGLTRARVTQILSLLNLASEIQEYILSMPMVANRPIVTERSLRPVTFIEDQRKQLQAFEELIRIPSESVSPIPSQASVFPTSTPNHNKACHPAYCAPPYSQRT